MYKEIDLSGHTMVLSEDISGGRYGKFQTFSGGSDVDATGGTLINAYEARELSKAFAEMADELTETKDSGPEEPEETVLEAVESDSGMYISINVNVMDVKAAEDLVVKAIKEAKKKGRL